MSKKMMMKALFILNCFILASCGQSSGNAPGIKSDTGGGGGGGGTTPAVACDPCIIFGTNATVQGDFAYYHGAVGVADGMCASDVNKPNDGSTYKALLMAGSRSLTNDWVLHPTTSYKRPNGNLIAVTDSTGKLDTTIMSGSITGTADYFWTGIKTGWVANTGADCQTWGDGTSSFSGAVGNGSSNGYTSIGGAVRTCDNLFKFYCVQQ